MSVLMDPPSREGIPGKLALQVLSGSHAYGTATPTSDTDWRGVYLLPNDEFLGLERAQLTFERKATDEVYWEVGQFCRLLLKGNPNLVEMLWTPNDCFSRGNQYILVAPLFEERERFLARPMVSAYMGWASKEMRDIERLHKGNAKRLSHVPRLLGTLKDVLEGGEPDPRLKGARLDLVMGIKTGEVPYDEAFAECGSLLLDVEDVFAKRASTFGEAPTEWTREYLLGTRDVWGS